jgi:hypothetical protein
MSRGPFEDDAQDHDPVGVGVGAGDRAGPEDMGQVLRQGLKSALARWVLAKRRGAGRPGSAVSSPHGASAHGSGAHGAGVAPQDEATHAWDGQRRFAEDYTFVGAQPGLGVMLRLEQLPGRDSQRIWAVVMRPEGTWSFPGGQLVLRTTGDDRWRAGGLHLDCETPLHRWALRFSGTLERQGSGGEAPLLHVVGDASHRRRVSLDLTFVATAAPYVPGTDDDPELLARCLSQATWDARLLQAVRRDRPRGYVQLGELHGTLALGDVLVPVRAASLRQHHWGVRDWGACDEAFECFWSTHDRQGHDRQGNDRQGEDRRGGWLHHARFPFVTLDGGFVVHGGRGRDTSAEPWSHAGRIEPVRRIGATFEARTRGAPARASLTVGDAETTRQVQLELCSDVSFVVDGRGRVDLGLVRTTGPTEGWGIWAGLHRTLARR